MSNVLPLSASQEVGAEKRSRALLRYSFRYGSVDEIKGLHEKGMFLISSLVLEQLLKEAAHFGRLDIIRYIHQGGVLSYPLVNSL